MHIKNKIIIFHTEEFFDKKPYHETSLTKLSLSETLAVASKIDEYGAPIRCVEIAWPSV